jgi:hypothetical protein
VEISLTLFWTLVRIDKYTVNNSEAVLAWPVLNLAVPQADVVRHRLIYDRSIYGVAIRHLWWKIITGVEILRVHVCKNKLKVCTRPLQCLIQRVGGVSVASATRQPLRMVRNKFSTQILTRKFGGFVRMIPAVMSSPSSLIHESILNCSFCWCIFQTPPPPLTTPV